MIWIFTDTEWQPIADRLKAHLGDAGQPVEVFTPERSPRLTVEIDGPDLAVRDGRHRLAEPEVVIVLRSPIPRPADVGDLDNDALQFVRSQWAIMFAGLYRALEYRGVRLINPTIANAADEKTHQMVVAAACGLTTLPTLHSASGGEIDQRWSNDELAAKPFITVVRRDLRSGRQRMVRTIAMSGESLAAGLDESRVKAPSIVQPFVATEFEHRVVVVGDRVHGARVPRTGGAEIDIRSVPIVELGATPSVLPAEVQAKCRRLVRAVGADIAAIDLLETDDDYIFLDLNCSGHFLYVEQLTGAPICADIAALAVAARPKPADELLTPQ